MKKIITIVISIYLFFMFLVYCGIFRNNNNPLDVVKYYFECLKNREGFLTYQISTPEYFDPDIGAKKRAKFKLHNFDRMELNLIKINNGHAYVKAKIIYTDKQYSFAFIELKNIDSAWLINDIK